MKQKIGGNRRNRGITAWMAGFMLSVFAWTGVGGAEETPFGKEDPFPLEKTLGQIRSGNFDEREKGVEKLRKRLSLLEKDEKTEELRSLLKRLHLRFRETKSIDEEERLDGLLQPYRAGWELWRTTARPQHLVLSGSRLLLATKMPKAEVRALEVETGAHCWTMELQNSSGKLTSLQVDGGRFYATGGYPWHSELTSDPWLVCGDVETGEVLWEKRLGLKGVEPERQLVHGSLGVQGEFVLMSGFVKTQDPETTKLEKQGKTGAAISVMQFLECYRAKTGELLWRTEDDVPLGIDRILIKGELGMIGGHTALVGVDLGTGRVKWKVQWKKKTGALPVFSAGDGRVICGFIDRGAIYLRCFDVKTGELRWENREMREEGQRSPRDWIQDIRVRKEVAEVIVSGGQTGKEKELFRFWYEMETGKKEKEAKETEDFMFYRKMIHGDRMYTWGRNGVGCFRTKGVIPELDR